MPRTALPLAYLLFGCLLPAAASAAENAAVVRVGDDIRYLASDELEGRGPGTKGLQAAADHIAAKFQALGLAGGGVDGTYMHPFEIAIDTKVIEEKTSLVLTGPDGERIELKRGKDYQALATGGPGDVSAAVVFAGYGISAPKLKYDDYQDADVEGKIVLIIRREPQQEDEKSAFEGKKTSTHAFISTKIAAAKKAKAAAILLVNDPLTTNDKPDSLTSPSGFGTRNAKLPFAHVSQQVANRLLASAPLAPGDEKLSSVQQLAAAIDRDLKPRTQLLAGWKAELRCAFEEVRAEVSNVIGVLEGEGPLADETIVIGAHYDHLGYGPFGSRRPNKRAIHNGADDNATGTAAVVELAHRFATAEKKPARRLVFVAFTAEERGILGSNRYIAKPAFPLEKTIAMINFDMIGQYGKQGLTVGGANTAKEFAGIVDNAVEGLEINLKKSRSVGGSDHAGFYRKQVPVLFFHTGLTDLYHTPEDDFETIDVEGAVQTIDVAERVVRGIAAAAAPPEYVKIAAPRRRAVVYLGVVPVFEADLPGAKIAEVADDSPAARAGVMAGDLIVKLDNKEIKSFRDLAAGLAGYKVDQQAKLKIRRADKELTLTVKLAGPPK